MYEYVLYVAWQVRVFRPPNYAGMLALGVLIALVLALLYVKRSSLDFLYNRTAWALMAIVRLPLLFLLLLCSHFLLLLLRYYYYSSIYCIYWIQSRSSKFTLKKN